MLINPEGIEKICGNCQLFHLDTSNSGQEANQSAAIIARQKPTAAPNILYGKMGCFNDTYGTLSTERCTEPSQFEPRGNINSTSQS